MKVTEVQFVPTKPQRGCIGFVSFILNDCLYCGSIAVHTRPEGGIRLVWPTINNRGHRYPTCHPLTRELSEKIEGVVSSEVMSLLPI